jgi:hypothetical protein
MTELGDTDRKRLEPEAFLRPTELAQVSAQFRPFIEKDAIIETRQNPTK